MTRICARRKKRSSRKRPASISWRRSRCVAAITRTSTGTGSWLPTRVTSRCSSTRRNFAWIPAGSSPISSRNTVPPSAVSKRPTARRSAPVNAPFSWPKRSDSASVSGSAAASITTKGLSARSEHAVDRARDLLLARPRLALDEHAQALGRDALERREELAHGGGPADEVAERLGGAEGAGRGLVVEVEAEHGAADGELTARRELDLRHAVRAHPGPVGAARVAHVDVAAHAAKLEVDAADPRIGDDEVVGRVPAHRGERAEHGQRSPGPWTGYCREPRGRLERLSADARVLLGPTAPVGSRHGVAMVPGLVLRDTRLAAHTRRCSFWSSRFRSARSPCRCRSCSRFRSSCRSMGWIRSTSRWAVLRPGSWRRGPRPRHRPAPRRWRRRRPPRLPRR